MVNEDMKIDDKELYELIRQTEMNIIDGLYKIIKETD